LAHRDEYGGDRERTGTASQKPDQVWKFTQRRTQDGGFLVVRYGCS
jgi:hypothetical protein